MLFQQIPIGFSNKFYKSKLEQWVRYSYPISDVGQTTSNEERVNEIKILINSISDVCLVDGEFGQTCLNVG